MKKTDDLLTIVWVSIPIRFKLPSRVRRLLPKVIILNCDNLWTLAVKGRETGLLVSCNMIGGTDGLSIFGHSVKRPSASIQSSEPKSPAHITHVAQNEHMTESKDSTWSFDLPEKTRYNRTYLKQYCWDRGH